MYHIMECNCKSYFNSLGAFTCESLSVPLPNKIIMKSSPVICMEHTKYVFHQGTDTVRLPRISLKTELHEMVQQTEILLKCLFYSITLGCS